VTHTPERTRDVSVRKDGGQRPALRRVLIANRGEIALRIIRTCRDLGIETVAVFSDADVSAAHVRAADAAVRIGAAPPGASYLRGEAIIDAALVEGADAIHPGYGFLSERATFARAVVEAGLTWIGPSPDAIDAIGDKLAARRTAAANGVPVVPGTFEPAPVDRPDALEGLLVAADEIGFPLLVKASAGGGGRGMRLVERARDLPAALSAGAAEARSAFGDGSVYLERAISPARHIEVQLLGDESGDVVALGERDCSIQRRHQKLVEESPAPGLSRVERTLLHEMAVRAARAAGLHNAATAEFLFDLDRRFWFLEVNARLQVEHGVTELVTDLDLVAEQLSLATGAPLSPAVRAAGARASDPDRHAVEIRLAAEDPSRHFAPTPGRIGEWVMPAGPGVRVDSAVGPGDRIPPDYDPMIAKIMTVGPDRATAMRRMRRALDEVVVTGIQTTIPFDRHLLRDAGFLSGEDLAIDWVDRHWDGEADRAARRAAGARIAMAAVDAAGDRPPGASLRTDTSVSSGRWAMAAREDGVDRWPR
jgi:acetyl-CoA carboxylase biotin carboxylase subunit